MGISSVSKMETVQHSSVVFPKAARQRLAIPMTDLATVTHTDMKLGRGALTGMWMGLRQEIPKGNPHLSKMVKRKR